MKYIENRIFTSSQGTEPITAFLLLNGIDNISVEDPMDIREILKNKDNIKWDFIDESLLDDDAETVVTFYSEDNDSGERLLENIKIELMKLKSDEMYGVYGEGTNFGRLYMESVELDDEWKDEWKKNLHPFSITDRIIIKPTWEEYNGKNDEQVIEIDPGMAFGTGTHETTNSCAGLLEQTIQQGDDILDIGTGTGILALIAMVSGAEHVDAYDVDPDAIKVAQNNIAINGFRGRIDVLESDILNADISNKYEIIVGNLTSGIIIRMLNTVKDALKYRGKLILSGMLAEEKTKMDAVFSEEGLHIEEEIIDGDWYTVLLVKHGG